MWMYLFVCMCGICMGLIRNVSCMCRLACAFTQGYMHLFVHLCMAG